MMTPPPEVKLTKKQKKVLCKLLDQCLTESFDFGHAAASPAGSTPFRRLDAQRKQAHEAQVALLEFFGTTWEELGLADDAE